MSKATWESITKPWELLTTLWELFDFFVEVFGVGGKTRRQYKNIYGDLDREKKKKIVKLICMVKGQKIEEEKIVDDFEISVNDIELVLERAKRVRPQLFVENISE
jgi:hypothetical protein